MEEPQVSPHDGGGVRGMGGGGGGGTMRETQGGGVGMQKSLGRVGGGGQAGNDTWQGSSALRLSSSLSPSQLPAFAPLNATSSSGLQRTAQQQPAAGNQQQQPPRGSGGGFDHPIKGAKHAVGIDRITNQPATDEWDRDRAPQIGDQQMAASKPAGGDQRQDLGDLQDARSKLLARVQNLKTDLQEWRGKLDSQVRTYRQELGDLRNSLNTEVEQLRAEFRQLRATLRKQLETTAKLAASRGEEEWGVVGEEERHQGTLSTHLQEEYRLPTKEN
ncbi:hypothetical protein CBR_g38207 [Chara braunii]|uniref:Uncharacterized protein n=1 Tax=Chara braunii TaxID=69332 RepID=A0A388LPG2_CHABU|nr:hypothetical protein CBR_g38207 [Chara braunii]|eukprot:GBG84236.1 hypothetical protein CBR_g38207 [Chara braunii]